MKNWIKILSQNSLLSMLLLTVGLSSCGTSDVSIDPQSSEISTQTRNVIGFAAGIPEHEKVQLKINGQEHDVSTNGHFILPVENSTDDTYKAELVSEKINVYEEKCGQNIIVAIYQCNLENESGIIKDHDVTIGVKCFKQTQYNYNCP